MDPTELPGYRLLEQIHDGTKTRVFRARREMDQRPVVVKLLKEAYSTERELARFQLGYAIGKRIESPRVIAHLGLERCPDTLALVTEDYGAVSLDRVRTGALDLERRLELAIALADALADVHAEHVIHKDVKPHNVVVNTRTWELKLIDFGISCQLSREHSAVTAPERLEGTLAYISPEQTGRMNRAIDSRSDLYSLGVTLYELFTGGLPFASEDAMELVHCHIARAPEPPCDRDGRVPRPVSDIVLRLLAKTAESRYQSAFGVRHDLARCLSGLREHNRVEPFPLGERDVFDRFVVPERLYGREEERGELMRAFAYAAQGARELLLVAGSAGIGKSALIHEVHRPIVERHGYFCAGKFDQFRRHLPYQALIDALRDLMRQVLSESERRIAFVRARLAEALGPNGRVVADVVPELVQLVGPQPDVEALGSIEARNRFDRVFTRFIGVFAAPEHPLTIFLDDLQWADLPSLQLVEVLVGDVRASHLLVVGAYRDNEVPETHPLVESRKRLEAAGVRVRRIRLQPLPTESVVRLVADAAACPPDEARDLGQLVMAKTGGNPFFVGEFLRALYRDGHLAWDRNAGRWTWNLAALVGLQTTDNVVELVTAKLNTLPDDTRQLLELAACVGSRFDLRTLARVAGVAPAEAARRLGPALLEELVLPLDSAYKYAHTLGDTHPARGTGETPSYRFLHDRVQQAAYLLQDEAARTRTHLRIGRVLEAECDAQERDARLVEIANHLDMARALVVLPAERLALARLHLEAGRRAQRSMAFVPSAHYLGSALELLPADTWTADYPLALAVHAEAADALRLTERYDALVALWQIVEPRVRDPLDRVGLQRTRIQALMAQGSPNAALDLALEVLGGLGVRLPRRPRPYQVLLGLWRTRRAIAGRTPRELALLPDMTDPRILAAMDILRNNASSAYFTDARLFALIVLEQVRLAALFGNSDLAANAYVLYGMLLCGATGEIDLGYEFGTVAFEVLARHPSASLAGKMSMIWGNFIAPWKDPIAECATALRAGWRAAVDGGDIEYAGYVVVQSVVLSVLGGTPLGELLDAHADHAAWLRGTRQLQSTGFVDAWLQAATHLRSPERIVRRLAGDVFDLDARLPGLERANDGMTQAYASVADAVLAQTLNDPARAAASAARALAHRDHLFASQMLPMALVIHALASCDLARAGAGSRGAARRALRRAIGPMRRWARANPAGFAHRLALLEAERAWLAGRLEPARAGYRAAIDGARRAGRLNDEAWANERCAALWSSVGEPQVARLYLGRARHAYQLWGALAKVRDLEANHPELAEPAPELASTTRAGTTTARTTTSDHTHADLDLATVLKASQTISEEVGLRALLTRMIRILIEAAGADRGILLLEQAGTLRIEADGSPGGEPVVLQGLPLDGEGAPPLATSVVQYVARTREVVVLDDASAGGLFAADPYLARHAPRSLLCSPILHHGERLLGVLYLENQLAPGAFGGGRVALLEMLSTQMAISIENARLYLGLEDKVRERTREVSDALEDLRRMQRHLVTSEKMAALGGLVAGVAHEINTPVGIGLTAASYLRSATVRFVELFESGRMKRSDLERYCAEMREGVGLVESNLDRAARLVQSFKQVAVDQSTEGVRVFKLGAYLEEFLVSLRPRLRATPHAVRVDCPPELELRCDPGAVAQVATNLVMNSIAHAYPAGGAGTLAFAAREDGERVVLTYSDDGAGIAPEVLPRIFEPFFTTSRHQGGTGLGLHIVHNLVTQRLGGTIEATSELGRGARFTIALPRNRS